MKQYQVLITESAQADLEAIYRYISEVLAAPETARKQYQALAQAALSLSDLPERCPLLPCEPERSRGLRRLLVNRYSVIYQIHAETVTVLRVLYSASDWVSRLRGDQPPSAPSQ